MDSDDEEDAGGPATSGFAPPVEMRGLKAALAISQQSGVPLSRLHVSDARTGHMAPVRQFAAYRAVSAHSEGAVDGSKGGVPGGPGAAAAGAEIEAELRASMNKDMGGSMGGGVFGRTPGTITFDAFAEPGDGTSGMGVEDGGVNMGLGLGTTPKALRRSGYKMPPQASRMAQLATGGSTAKAENSELEKKREERLARQAEAEERTRVGEIEPHVLKVLRRQQKRKAKAKQAEQAGMPPPDTFMAAVDRMENTERARRQRMDTARAEDAYAKKVDKKVCPSCGLVQTYAEVLKQQKGKRCASGCGKEYAVPSVTSAFAKRLEADYAKKQVRKKELVRKQIAEESTVDEGAPGAAGRRAQGLVKAQKRAEQLQRAATTAFQVADSDQNGFVDQSELDGLARALGEPFANEAERVAALDCLDQTGDGKIDMDEFISWWQCKVRRGGKRGRGGGEEA
jgi:hypothetical protein